MLLFRIHGKEAGYHVSKNLHSESDCFDSELSTHLIYNIKISSLPMRCSIGLISSRIFFQATDIYSRFNAHILPLRRCQWKIFRQQPGLIPFLNGP